LGFTLLCLLACPCQGAQSDATNPAPAIAAAQSTNVLAAFRVKPGFRVELVAADPLIASPVAIAFDENGRLFVAESRNLAAPGGPSAGAGRVRLLEDTDGTGEYTSSTIYADKLPLASAVACYAGGVFLAAGPEILYLKDTRTNGIAHVRNVVCGIEAATNTQHAPARPNNFNWGLDNRIHSACAGTADDTVFSPTTGGAAVALGNAFSFDPRGLTVTTDGARAQSGLTFDDQGRLLVSDFTRPLRQALFPAPYRERNPFFPPPPLMGDVLSPATAVYRPGTQATNPPVLTWLTNVQGCTIYRGNAFPTAYLGNAFIADPSAHVIHRAVLRETGLELSASRAADESRSEFLTSTNLAFRPVQVVNAPDGALYVVDAADGRDRGRIYRIVPENFKAPKKPRFGKATTTELLAMLAHPNGWHRDTAARLLYERRDPEVVEPLANLLYRSRVPLTRLHALHALAGLGSLSDLSLSTALRDTDERVRADAVLLAPMSAAGGALPDPLWNQLRLLANDPSLRVRYQLGLTLGDLRQPGAASVLASLLWQPPSNPLVQAAAFSSLTGRGGETFVILAGNEAFRSSAAGQALLRRLATMIGVRGEQRGVAQVIGFIAQAPMESQQALPLLTALGRGLHRAGSSLPHMDPEGLLTRFYSDASNLLFGSTTIAAWRVAGIELLAVGQSSFADTGDLLLLPLGSGQAEAVQSAAIDTLGSYSDPRVAPALLRRWGVLTPRLRQEALAALMRRAQRLPAVLDAVGNGVIGRADLTSDMANLLRTDADRASAERALQRLGPLYFERPAVVQRYSPALTLKGTPTRGRDLFLARCASCHKSPGLSPGAGPELATARIHGKLWTFAAILEPSRAVRPGYESAVIETTEGEIFWGILLDGNDDTVTLQQVKGRPIVLRRSNIIYLQPRPWSLMPEGLERDLTPQDLADLLEYLIAAPR